MKKLNLLIIDDELGILYFLKMFLRKKDYAVAIAENGLVALDMIKRNNYDMLITNLNMPGINGLELLRKAKKLKPRLITIIHSGSLTLAGIKKAIRLGCFAYIKKPASLKQIDIIIKKAFTTQRIKGTILLGIA